MALPWIKLMVDFPDHPKALELAEQLDEPLAVAYLVHAWTWAARYAPDGRITGRYPARAFERACRWQGPPGKLAEACREVGFLDEDDGGALVLHDFSLHNVGHLEKLERDRLRMVERREVARRSRDGRATVERPSDDGRPLEQNTTQRQLEREEHTHTETPAAPAAPEGGGVGSPLAPLPEKDPSPVPPAPGGAPPAPAAPAEIQPVFAAWHELVDPAAPITASRLALVDALVAPKGPYRPEELVAAIEGVAGSPFWQARAHLVTIERVFESPEKVDSLRRLRANKDWKHPRPKKAAPAPPARAPAPEDEAKIRAEAEAARKSLREKHGWNIPAPA